MIFIPIPIDSNGFDLEPTYIAAAEVIDISYEEMIALDQFRFNGDFSNVDVYDTLELFLDCSVEFRKEYTFNGQKNTKIITKNVQNIHDYRKLMDYLDRSWNANNPLDIIEDLKTLDGEFFGEYKMKVNINYKNLDQVMDDLNMSNEDKEFVLAVLDLGFIGNKSYLLPADFKVFDEKGHNIYSFPTPKLKNITSSFGNRIHPITGKLSFHYGIDISGENALNSPIVSIADGIIKSVGNNDISGNYIIIESTIDNHKMITKYLHLNKIYKRSGTVGKGEIIGTVGNTGRSTGPHLHFSVQLDESYIDPLKIF